MLHVLPAGPLLISRSVSRWVPAVLIVFVALIPFASHLGRVGSAMQILLLGVAFTGIAMAAVQGASNASEADAAAF